MKETAQGRAVWYVFPTSGKQTLGRPRRRWEDNINMNLRAICWGPGLDLSDSG